jgi:hypothetical protein
VDPWVGPAIIAAIVSGMVSAAGWFVTSWQQLRLERQRRTEKVHDFQVALRAEIETDLITMEVVDRTVFFEEIRSRYTDDPNFSVVVPHLSANVVFDVVVKEIHILPGEVISQVVMYARLRQIVGRFIDDMRSDSFKALPASRQLAMYRDYLDTLDRLEALAQQAVAALDRSLALNSRDADQPNPKSASGPGEERAEALSEPTDEP